MTTRSTQQTQSSQRESKRTLVTRASRTSASEVTDGETVSRGAARYDEGFACHRSWLSAFIALLVPTVFGISGCSDEGDGGEAPMCGGIVGVQCAVGEFCNFPIDARCGAADATGTCEAVPAVCTKEYAPVCGCDGETYANSCMARAAGVSVQKEGACESGEGDAGGADAGGRVCGGLLGAQCNEGEFCNYPKDALCGRADAVGVCEVEPEACDADYRPVCGCDGETYSNACVAHASGVSVEREGACAESSDAGGRHDAGGSDASTDVISDASTDVSSDTTGGDASLTDAGGDDSRGHDAGTDSGAERACGGIAGLQCDEAEFCNFPEQAMCGANDGLGTCQVVPGVCSTEYSPVCGCDGETYGNACQAHARGVSVLHQGDCSSEPSGHCNDFAGAGCAEGNYCNYEHDARCGASGTGMCEPIPTGCTKEYNPVCGCDGETYGNPCMSAAAGVAVEHAGECEPSNCGGFLGLICDEGEYCDYPPDATCGFVDATGVCKSVPLHCGRQSEPVCGCDGQTYRNACAAHAAGISVASEGACKPVGTQCGGLLGISCNKNEFCLYSLEAACGAGDRTGLCEPRPDACPANVDPVCGCDGKTYSNACVAHAASVSIVSEDSCLESL